MPQNDNAQTLKIGFVIPGDINDDGRGNAHYNGIKTACDEFGLELLVRDKVEKNTGQCSTAVEDPIQNDASMIFLASSSYPSEIRDIVDKYPNISFATVSTKEYSKNMTAYFVRMYQGRYMLGAPAAMKTKSNVIGCIAAMPDSAMYRDISAFALGAQSINPNVKIVVSHSNSAALIKAGADVFSDRQGALIDVLSEKKLASMNCRWDLFYGDIIRRYLKGELNSVRNRLIGVKRDAVRLSEFSNDVTPEMQERIELMRQELIADKLIFSGELHDNRGNIRCAAGEAVTDDVLIEKFDWLVRGVEVLD